MKLRLLEKKYMKFQFAFQFKFVLFAQQSFIHVEQNFRSKQFRLD